MTTDQPEQLHLEVLKAMGWTHIDSHCMDGFSPDHECNKIPETEVVYGPRDALPRLTLDLMWQADEMLSDDERWAQIKLITDWRPSPSGFPLLSRSEAIALLRSTAEQRARAFLKVKGIACTTTTQTKGHQ